MTEATPPSKSERFKSLGNTGEKPKSKLGGCVRMGCLVFFFGWLAITGVTVYVVRDDLKKAYGEMKEQMGQMFEESASVEKVDKISKAELEPYFIKLSNHLEQGGELKLEDREVCILLKHFYGLAEPTRIKCQIENDSLTIFYSAPVNYPFFKDRWLNGFYRGIPEQQGGELGFKILATQVREFQTEQQNLEADARDLPFLKSQMGLLGFPKEYRTGYQDVRIEGKSVVLVRDKN